MIIAKEDAETILAYHQGETIQFSSDITDEWRDIGGVPTWRFDVTRYRVKPEPKELWINEYGEYTITYKKKHQALQHASPNTTRIAVHYREVIEE